MSLLVPTSYDSLIAVSLNALRVTLPGAVTWKRPRATVRRDGIRSAYPDDYVQGREVWRLVVQHAVRETGWAAPPVEAPLMVEAEVVAGGKLDLDRVVTAVLDALEGGGALANDCRCWELHAVRRRPTRGAAPRRGGAEPGRYPAAEDPEGGELMLRGMLRYACGAEVQLLYPEDDPGVLERKRKEAAEHECPYCEGDLAEGLEALLSPPTLEHPDGTVDLFHYTDVTEKGAAR